MKFTAHNILLPDGSFTMGYPGEHKDCSLCNAIYGTINIIGEKLSILDLGCLEGGYSLELAKKGHKVLGLRKMSIHKR